MRMSSSSLISLRRYRSATSTTGLRCGFWLGWDNAGKCAGAPHPESQHAAWAGLRRGSRRQGRTTQPRGQHACNAGLYAGRAGHAPQPGCQHASYTGLRGHRLRRTAQPRGQHAPRACLGTAGRWRGCAAHPWGQHAPRACLPGWGSCTACTTDPEGEQAARCRSHNLLRLSVRPGRCP
jgi:hypothetical protein